jgi:anti-sigma factor (TIGR02949 family)
MSCEWRDKVALYVDDELDQAAQKEFAAHLAACPECPTAVEAQMELKKALRVAGRSFSAPPELHASVYRSLHPRQSVSPWWKWVMAPLCLLFLGTVAFLMYPKAPGVDPMIASLVDSHITALASEHPVDVVNSDRHIVKPWFQGKLPFTFTPPEVKGTPFNLIGGKLVYIGQRPGAELLYQTGQHKISIFIFQARTRGNSAPVWDHDVSFTASSWTAGGRDCYLVSDASKDEASQLVTMFQEANRS